MTIFDVIRYPISDVPTAEEMEALPRDLFKKWARENGWGAYDYRQGRIAGAYYKGSPYEKDIPILRQMIKDYDGCI